MKLMTTLERNLIDTLNEHVNTATKLLNLVEELKNSGSLTDYKQTALKLYTQGDISAQGLLNALTYVEPLDMLRSYPER